MISSSVCTATAVLGALVRAGLRHLVVAPGSRSAPVAYAAAAAHAAGAIEVHVRVDERDAAFTALGIARASGRPAAVLTTSGTAAGELLPAVMEASHSGVPLIALTADRPPELRGTGANQTTQQPGLFAAFVRAELDLIPDDDAGSRAESRPAAPKTAPRGRGAATAGGGIDVVALESALAALTGDAEHAPGPVHVNLALRDPLYPTGEADHEFLAEWADELGACEATARTAPREAPTHPWSVFPEPLRIDPVRVLPGEQELPRRTDPAGTRVVMVAGDGAGAGAARFAWQAGIPLLAEASSGARWGEASVQAHHHLLVSDLERRVDAVILVGRPTLSRDVARLLAREHVRVIAVRPGPAPWYDPGRRSEMVVPDYRAALDAVGPVREGWYEQWCATGARMCDAVRHAASQDPTLTGMHAAYAVWEACARDDALLVCGSSNPVRDLTRATRAEVPVRVIANRGVAGIDGTVATAHGVALGTGEPVRALVGDLTMLHDAGGLLLGPTERIPDVHIVVANDGGGGIFETLEHGRLGRDPRYTDTVERFFGTPHAVSFAELAAAYGVEYTRAETATELAAALAAPVRGRRLTEVVVTRHGLADYHEKLAEVARRAVR